MNFLAKVLKKSLQPFKVWLGPLLFIRVQLKAVQLYSKHFSPNLSLCILYLLFHKGKGTSTVRSSSCICFPHFLSFSLNALITFFAEAKISMQINFSLEHMFLPIFTSMTLGSCPFLCEVK